jgi:isopentenyl-diphosphate delta-isomerase
VSDEVQRRKEQHLRLAAGGEITATVGAGFDEITLIHDALPEIDLADVDTSTAFLGHRLELPIVIASMTGGHPVARDVNATLARAAARHGLAMGVGSQRAALLDPQLADTYGVARREAPGILLLANIGAPQLVQQGDEPPLTLDEIRRSVEMIGADALVVHLNALQEVVQPEGQTNAAGWLDAIARLVETAGVPVIAKETGAGISRSVAERLARAGVAAIDVGGLGGTSFAAIEAARAEERGDAGRAALGEALRDWGIPTAASVLSAAGMGVPIIATGGIRSGLDAARALAIGASLVGVARPALQRALESDEALDDWLAAFGLELRAAMFLTGSPTLDALRSAERILSPWLQAWVRAPKS